MSDEPREKYWAALSEAWNNLATEQQTGLVVFSVCGVLTLTFSGWYLRSQIRAPFLTSRQRFQEARQFVSERDKEAETEAELKTKDTDGDGVSDWDELNVYRTSPYLIDSDSDGISDSAEISDGTDPNCPKDRECQPRLDGLIDRATSSSGQELRAGVGPAIPSIPTGTPPAQMTAPEIRAFLIANRLATSEELKGLSDQALIQLYQRASQGTSPANPSPDSPSSGTPAPAPNAVPSP